MVLSRYIMDLWWRHISIPTQPTRSYSLDKATDILSTVRFVSGTQVRKRYYLSPPSHVKRRPMQHTVLYRTVQYFPPHIEVVHNPWAYKAWSVSHEMLKKAYCIHCWVTYDADDCRQRWAQLRGNSSGV